MKRFILIICILTMFATISVLAGQAEWTYPIEATILEDRLNLLVLTNNDNLLSSDFVPPRLVDLKLRATNRGMQLRQEAAEALEDMFNKASEDGYTLYVKSAYRNYQTQNTMYQNRLDKYRKDDGVVAYPGSSEHQTGLAVDILNYAWTQQDGMRPEFSLTDEAKWMKDNCAKFGFILRYPEDKTDITGIIFEPWHFRYVGKEVAAYIMDNGLTFEEFHEEYKGAIAAYEAAGGDFIAYCEYLRQLPEPIELNQGDNGDSEVSLFYQVP
ncbi:MAG: M15 family metallopeptidase [Christensenellaceae bacterium]|nr:M15 family metallopeptidase [Christensenellaceae bacterium]